MDCSLAFLPGCRQRWKKFHSRVLRCEGCPSFDGLDVNDDGLVKKNEARLENFFHPVFLSSIAQEFFDYLDKNNDDQISVADITRCEPYKETPFCLHMDPLENKTVDNCQLLGSPLQHVCTTLMTTYFSPDFDL